MATTFIGRIVSCALVVLLLVEKPLVEGFLWTRPGCHKVGYTRRVSIPDCIEFDVTTNACRGFCVSYSVPTSQETLKVHPNRVVTVHGQCCNIMETEDVKVQVMCLEGPRELVFKSAKTCACFHCKKD